jgi:hypothetical protein
VDPILIPAGAVIAIALGLGWRLLVVLSNKVDDHAERIAWLEAKMNGKGGHEQR